MTTAPLNITYHEGTGNVIVGMGLQGVLVGNSDEEWRRVAVEDLTPANFSFAGKALLAFSAYFWVTALAISFSVVTAALVFSPRSFLTDSTPATPELDSQATRTKTIILSGIVILLLVAVWVIGPLVIYTPSGYFVFLAIFWVLAFLI